MMMKSKSGSTKDKQIHDEKRFKEAYCKALAEALLEKDLKETKDSSQNTTSVTIQLDDLANAYRGLCFDFPTPPPFEHANELSQYLFLTHLDLNGNIITPSLASLENLKKQLFAKRENINENLKQSLSPSSSKSSTTKPLALSNRFVNGLIDICSTVTTNKRLDAIENKPQTNNQGKENNTESFQQYMDGTANMSLYNDDGDDSKKQKSNENNEYLLASSTQGCNVLSFITFALGPLACLHLLKQISSSSSSSQLNQVQQMQIMNSIHSFLGSYEHQFVSTNNNNNNVNPMINNDEQSSSSAINELLASMNQMNILSSTNQPDKNHNENHKEHLDNNIHDDNENNEDDDASNYDHDSLQEIWAEESDPDDYDYGDERYQHHPTTNNNDSNDNPYQDTIESTFELLDPYQLSQKIKQRSMVNIIKCLHSLINELSFAKLSQMKDASSGRSDVSLWDEWNVSEVLYDLTFTLLQFTNKSLIEDDAHRESNSNEIGHLITQHLSNLYIKPLIVLRDCALDERFHYHSSSNKSCGINHYTNLLTIMLRSEEKVVGKFASINYNVEDSFQCQLSPSRMIALSSLAAFCVSTSEYLGSSSSIPTLKSNSKLVKQALYCKIKQVLLDSLDDLAKCIEIIRPKAKLTQQDRTVTSNDDPSLTSSIPAWVHVVMSLLPILDVLTGINSRSDFTTMVHSSSNTCFNTSEAQLILQSGLFREMLLLYSSTAKISDSNLVGNASNEIEVESAQEVIRVKLLRSILTMSAIASSTLGKYASRVSALTQIIYSETFIRKNVIDSILWFALLAHLNVSNQSTMQLKIKGSLLTLSTQEMKGLCVKSSIKLFKTIIEVLCSKGESNTVEFYKSFSEFTTFTNCLNQIKNLSEFWLDSISTDKDQLQQSLTTMLKSLMEFQRKNTTKILQNMDNDDDSEKKSKEPLIKKPEYSLHCDKIRSSAKFLLLIIDSTKVDHSTGGINSKID